MIDIHTHLLPSVDDGSSDLNETRLLLETAIKDGTKDIVLTPHFCRMDNYVCRRKDLLLKFNNLKSQVKDLNINLYLGNELMIEQNLDTLLENNELLTINNSHYVLVEFPFDEYKKEYDEYLYNISSLGLKIIIAHPERYSYINENLINSWLKNKYCLQANARSFVRKDRKKLLFKLIQNGQLHIIASDAHNEYRPPVLSDTYKLISKKFNTQTAEILFNTNPYNVLNDIDLITLPKQKQRLF